MGRVAKEVYGASFLSSVCSLQGTEGTRGRGPVSAQPECQSRATRTVDSTATTTMEKPQ